MENFTIDRYFATLKLIFCKAVRDLYKDCKIFIEHSLNRGTYGVLVGNKAFSESDYEQLTKRMQDIINTDYPITLILNDCEELKRHSDKLKREDIKVLLDNSGLIDIAIYDLDGYRDIFYNHIAPYESTGVVSAFELSKYNNGFLLKYPRKADLKLPDYIDTPKVAEVFAETGERERILGAGTIGFLNQKIQNKEIAEFIRINEVLHQKKLAKISDEISSNPDIKLITIAGPSSSGKTTFSKRLALYLRGEELQPIVISLDDYYIGRDKIPLDEYGNKDYESIEGLDLELLNKNISDLIAGKEVEIPSYNFVTGMRNEKGHMMKLPENGIIIIEGIHGLNERMSASIPKAHKYKIYISCLTQLNIDYHNRIATSDVRLLRRLVRDSLSRATHVEDTLDMWASVRRGEEKNIFPFQEEADAIFNSNLVYELGVMKSFATRELVKVNINSPYYNEAKRLMSLLNCFLDIDSKLVPDDSLLKEFIGDSIFYRY